MDLAAQKALVARLLNKNSVIGRVTVRNESLNETEADKTAAVRVKLLKREAEAGDDAATITSILGSTPFAIEGGELLVNSTTYDIVSVEQTGVGDEHLLQRAVLRER